MHAASPCPRCFDRQANWLSRSTEIFYQTLPYTRVEAQLDSESKTIILLDMRFEYQRLTVQNRRGDSYVRLVCLSN